MKIKRSRIEQIVREELASHLEELLLQREAEGDEAEKKDKPKKPAVAGADKDNSDKEPVKVSKNTAPKVGAEKGPETPDGDQEAPEDSPTADAEKDQEEVPTGDDPADDELSKDVEEPEPEDAEDVGGDISNEIAGKTVQSITLEPESKIMAGAQELTIQFEEIPHPLKVLIGKSGAIKFLFKGSIHNEL